VGSGTATESTRAERDAARRRRAEERRPGKAEPVKRSRPGHVSAEDRPPPIWAPFPLTELVTFAGIVLMVWGILTGPGADANRRLGAGLAIASLAGLELAVREHVTGFRSHSALLAGATGVTVMVVLGLGLGVGPLGVVVVAGILAFAGAFVGLRRLFKVKSGGLSFR
jgi:hypothetical protein